MNDRTAEPAVGSGPGSPHARRGHRRALAVFFVAMAAATFLFELAKQLLDPGISLWESHAMTVLFVSAIATFAAHRVLLRQESQRAALERAEARYRALVEEANDLIWQMDRNGVFTFVSPRARSMLGHAPGDLLGASRYSLMRPRDAERMRAMVTHATPLPVFEAELRRKDGTWVDVETSTTPVFKGSILGGCQGIDRDVSARKLVERQREEDDRAKNDALAMIAHELRNPLTPIRNSLHILHWAAPGGDQTRSARAIAIMERQVNQLARIVDDLLDTTRVSRGKLRLQRRRLDLVEVVRRAAEDHRTLLENHQVAFELPESVCVDGDPTRLAQAIGNLLNNAAKFTPEGGKISVSLAEEAGFAALEVADTGMGMDSRTLQRLFVPFAQADRSLQRSGGGLGLGLALVKGLVVLHGGDVSAHSDGPGRGARFIVRLPLAEGRPAARATGHPRGTASSERRILVIESDKDAADRLSQALGPWSHHVVVACDGDAGLAKARELHPEIVLCDVGLAAPTDGYSVARALRRERPTASAYLVALTADAQSDDIGRALDAGFDAQVARSPDGAALERLLARAPTHRTPAGDEAGSP
jgi:PAS domain S-box-containing protein